MANFRPVTLKHVIGGSGPTTASRRIGGGDTRRGNVT
jgi:hypothetical protein